MFIMCRRVARMLRVWHAHHPSAEFFLADGFLDCACHEKKKQMKKNEPAGLLFTSRILAKSRLEISHFVEK